jgi:MoaA/NifB/PqqE/SkfB family radical SAM enzyme
MRLTYTFPNIPQLRGFSIDVENRGDKLFTKIHGAKGLLYGILFKLYFAFWNSRNVGPIVTREDGNIYSMFLPPMPSYAHMRQVENLLRNWLFKDRRPMAVTIAVTRQCQLGCVHCSALRTGSSGPDLSRDEIKRVVDECIELGVTNITFTGGEPLLRQDLEELVALVPGDKAVALVFTNALALDAKRAASLKAAGAKAVFISLDDPDSAIHDDFRRRPGAYQAVKEGVKNAIQAGLPVCLSTYASNESVREGKLARLAAVGKEWGVHEISVFDVIPTGKLLREDNILLTKENHKELRRQAFEINKLYGGRPRVVTQSWTNTRSGMAIVVGCLAGHLQFHVTSVGDFTPCDFTPLSFGNVRTESVGAIWRKVIEHPAFRKHCYECRMQTASFREKYICAIPPEASLPYPIALLDGKAQPEGPVQPGCCGGQSGRKQLATS